MKMPMRKREIAGMLVGLAVAAIALSVAVVISANYEDLGDRSVPFIYAPGAGVFGFIVAMIIADGKPEPEIFASLRRGLTRLAVRLYRE